MRKEAIVMLCVVVFCAGALVGREIKDEVVIKRFTVEKEIDYRNFADLTKEDLEVALNFFNRTSITIEEIQKIKQDIWAEGYDEGYKKAVRKQYE